MQEPAGPFIGCARYRYRQRNCGLLLDRNSALGGNFTNDLTAAVVQALDVRISTITFNRETLPATPPAAPPPTR